MVSFTALADPKRRRIVELLASGEMAAGEINKHFRVSGPAISQHLKVLRDARLVLVRVDAQRRLYSLDPKGIDELQAWLSAIRKLWTHRLDGLERDLRGSSDRESDSAPHSTATATTNTTTTGKRRKKP